MPLSRIWMCIETSWRAGTANRYPRPPVQPGCRPWANDAAPAQQPTRARPACESTDSRLPHRTRTATTPTRHPRGHPHYPRPHHYEQPPQQPPASSLQFPRACACGAYVWRERVVRVRERGKRRDGAVQRGRSTMRASAPGPEPPILTLVIEARQASSHGTGRGEGGGMSSVEGGAGTEWVWMCELEGDTGAARRRVIYWARGGSSTTQRGGNYGLYSDWGRVRRSARGNLLSAAWVQEHTANMTGSITDSDAISTRFL